MNDQTLRRLTGAAVLLVAAIAATVSYLHIQHLAAQLGQPLLAAWLMPLSVDGTVGAASAALLWAARSGQRSPWTARTMLALGVLATLAANADFGSTHGAAGILMSAWPGIAFVGSAEVALGMVRKSASVTAPAVTETAIDMDMSAVIKPDSKPVIETDAATATAVARPTAQRSSARTAKPAKTAARAAAIVSKTPDINGAELGRRLGLSERSGRRLLVQMEGSS